jgi:hypothetical protein
MMSTLTPDSELNATADFAASRITHLSVHTATTGLIGEAEAIGGAPVYSRKPVTFNAAGIEGPLGLTLQPATVGVAWSSEVAFDVPAGYYTYWGAWSDVIAGVFRCGNELIDFLNLFDQGQIFLSIGVGPYVGA